MAEAWDLAAELGARVGESLAEAWRAMRQFLGTGLAVAFTCLCLLFFYYVHWAFWDKKIACETKDACRDALFNDPVMQRQMDAMCAMRRQDCNANFLARAPVVLFYDIYNPIHHTMNSLFWLVFWDYGIKTAGVIVIIAVLIILFSMVDYAIQWVEPVFVRLRKILGLAMRRPVAHARIE